MSTDRRQFLRQALLGGAAVGLAGALPINVFGSDDDLVKLTVLHTNDVHSRIEPFPANDPKYPGMGGTAIRAEIINRIRAEEENVLLLDAGDIFQGTPYFNLYGGELEMKLMSQMGYDAATIGNHDFDNGIDGLFKQLPHAKFPLINCNYDFVGTVMEGKTVPYQIVERGGLRIGILGVGVELDGLVEKRLYGGTVYLDPVQKANETAAILKQQKDCDLVICLSHLGYEYKIRKISDKMLAKESENIDLIIGGHTHTLLNEPTVTLNKKGKEVLINQVGWAGVRLGRIDFYFKRKIRQKKVASATIKVFKNQG